MSEDEKSQKQLNIQPATSSRTLRGQCCVCKQKCKQTCSYVGCTMRIHIDCGSNNEQEGKVLCVEHGILSSEESNKQ